MNKKRKCYYMGECVSQGYKRTCIVPKAKCDFLSPVPKKGKRVKHIIKECSLDHVLSWSSQGRHCSNLDCEVNYDE